MAWASLVSVLQLPCERGKNFEPGGDVVRVNAFGCAWARSGVDISRAVSATAASGIAEISEPVPEGVWDEKKSSSRGGAGDEE